MLPGMILFLPVAHASGRRHAGDKVGDECRLKLAPDSMDKPDAARSAGLVEQIGDGLKECGRRSRAIGAARANNICASGSVNRIAAPTMPQSGRRLQAPASALPRWVQPVS
jgi:hypothetical protein